MYSHVWTSACTGCHVTSRGRNYSREAVRIYLLPRLLVNVMCHRSKRKVQQSFLEISFQKHVYGCERKNNLKKVYDFDPHADEYHGTAPTRMELFLKAVKGKDLGVSVLMDSSTCV